MSRSIPRTIPASRPRLAASVRVPLREGAAGSVPFPPQPVVAGDLVLTCSGADSDGVHDRLRRTLGAFDSRSGEERFTLAVPHQRWPPEQASLPGAAPDGRIAQVVRRAHEVALLVADPQSGSGVIEVAPSVGRLPRAEEGDLSQPIAAPGGTWVASWGLKNADPRRLRTHRTECLRSEGGPPLWWADDERVLGAVEGIAVTRVATEGMVGHVIGRRIGTGAPVWETDIAPGSRVEMLGELLLIVDRSRRARERNRRYDTFVRSRAERIANDPLGARGVDWAAEAISAFRHEGRLQPAPVRAVDARTGAVRFRLEIPGDTVGPVSGGPHVVCAVVVDEEGVGGILRYRAADGGELGRRGFHVEELFYGGPPVWAEEFPELIAVDHTHLLWLDHRREIVCEVLSDPGREVWRLALEEPLPASAAFAVSAGRIFVRDAETLRIFSVEDP